jgi:hypothetical protein
MQSSIRSDAVHQALLEPSGREGSEGSEVPRGYKTPTLRQCCSALWPKTGLDRAIPMGAPANRHVEFWQFL